MKVITRARNKQLYKMMQSMLGAHDYIPLTHHGHIGAVDYLHDIFSNHSGFVVNCDEDCFISNPDAIHDIIAYMIDNDYDYCGVPDGGVVSHRTNSWTNVNPFFNVFNVDKIKPLYLAEGRKKIDSFFGVHCDKRPHFIRGNFNHNQLEPFAGLLYWLHYNFNPLYLNAKDHADGITSILLDLDNEPFGYHTWYSREYQKGIEHTSRIDERFLEAKAKRVKLV